MHQRVNKFFIIISHIIYLQNKINSLGHIDQQKHESVNNNLVQLLKVIKIYSRKT